MPGDRAESSLKTEILLVGRPELTFSWLIEYWSVSNSVVTGADTRLSFHAATTAAIFFPDLD